VAPARILISSYKLHSAKSLSATTQKNSGKQKIEELVFRRINPDLSTRDIPLPASSLEPGRIYEAEIPYQPTAKTHIEIVPKVIVDKNPILCDAKAIIREQIPTCSAE
jgi:hypothetical protein